VEEELTSLATTIQFCARPDILLARGRTGILKTTLATPQPLLLLMHLEMIASPHTAIDAHTFTSTALQMLPLFLSLLLSDQVTRATTTSM
jgi:hypothetical protein